MPKRGWSYLAAAGYVAIAVWATTAYSSQLRPDLVAVPPRPTGDAASCKYEEARKSADEATERRDNPPAPLSKAARTKAAKEAEAAERQKQEARICEERANEAADLEAQWASATSTQNSAAISDAFFSWSSVEVLAILLAVGAAFWAAIEARRAANVAQDQLLDERLRAPADEKRQLAQLNAASALASQDRAWVFVELGAPNDYVRPRRVGQGGPFFEAYVSFNLVNHGGTPAVLKTMHAELYWPFRPFDGEIDPESNEARVFQSRVEPALALDRLAQGQGQGPENLVPVRRFPRGGQWDFREAAIQGNDIILEARGNRAQRIRYNWDELQGEQFNDRACNLYFLVRIQYEDVRGNACETSFYRRISPGGGASTVQGPLAAKWNYRK